MFAVAGVGLAADYVSVHAELKPMVLGVITDRGVQTALRGAVNGAQRLRRRAHGRIPLTFTTHPTWWADAYLRSGGRAGVRCWEYSRSRDVWGTVPKRRSETSAPTG